MGIHHSSVSEKRVFEPPTSDSENIKYYKKSHQRRSSFGSKRVENPLIAPLTSTLFHDYKYNAGLHGDYSFRSNQSNDQFLNRFNTCAMTNNSMATFRSDGMSMSKISKESEYNRPRVKTAAAKELFETVFNPLPGTLECLASSFITAEQYRSLHIFFAPFLNSDLREKWFLDAIMVAALGKNGLVGPDGHRVPVNALFNTKYLPLLLRRRREYTDELRAHLMKISASLDTKEQSKFTSNLKNLVHQYRFQSNSGINSTHMKSVPSSAETKIPSISGSSHSSLSHAKSTENTSSAFPLNTQLAASNAQGRSGLHSAKRAYDTEVKVNISDPTISFLKRVQTECMISFECYNLIAKRIPLSFFLSLPIEYFSPSVPIIWSNIDYKEKIHGEIMRHSFFVSLYERVCLLQGLSSEGLNRGVVTLSLMEEVLIETSNFSRPNVNKGIITAAHLFMAVRNLGAVLTTACSSMVLYVLTHIADVICTRRHYCKLRENAKERGVTIEDLLGKDRSTMLRQKSTNGTPDLWELKRMVTTEEMSLTAFTQFLIANYQKEVRVHIENLRRRHTELFLALESLSPPEERAGFDPTRALGNIAFKLTYLIAGGQASIEAEDRRVLPSFEHATDDLNLSKMLEVPILDRICWVACMMGVPVMSSHGMLINEDQARTPNFLQIDECSGVMRELFQAVGALPCGSACPGRFQDWLHLFPLYAVSTEGKRILTYLYAFLAGPIKPLKLTIQRDMILNSFAESLKDCPNFNQRDLASYLFLPEMTVGYASQAKKTEPPTSDSLPSKPAVNQTQVSTIRKAFEANMVGSDIGNTHSSDKNNGDKFGKQTQSDSPNANEELAKTPAKKDECDSSSSCSTLLENDLNIDAYTCVSLPAQLYLRCGNEAIIRRHVITELTPFVKTNFFYSLKDLYKSGKKLPSDIGYGLRYMLPNEGILVIRWITPQPMVTFGVGDSIVATVERHAASSSGKRKRYFPDGQNRPTRDSNSAQANDYDEASEMQKASCDNMTSSNHEGSANVEDSASRNFDDSLSKWAKGHQELVNKILGTSNRVEKQVGVQWNVLQVFQNHTSRKAAKGKDSESAEEGGDTKHNEIILHVYSPEQPLTEQFRVLSIGHERATMSPFADLSGTNVCWSNPQLFNRLDGSLVPSALKLNSSDGNLQRLKDIFFAVGVLLANTIVNAVFLSIPLAPLVFLLFKRAFITGDYSFKSFTWLEPCDGNMLSRSLLLNLAYEIMTMDDTQYMIFLRSRGLTKPQNLVFPVRHSMAEANRLRNTTTNSYDSNEHLRITSSKPLNNNNHSGQTFNSDIPRSVSSLSSSSCGCANTVRFNLVNVREYLNAIRWHNYTNSLTKGSERAWKNIHFLHQVDLADASQERTPTAVYNSKEKPFPSGSNQATRSSGKFNTEDSSRRLLASNDYEEVPLEKLDSAKLQALLEQLPSREEYITLYLVNDLVWNLVRRNTDRDAVTKELWSNMAKGFLTSPVATSPLMKHCCSRVICKVLCPPSSNKSKIEASSGD